MRVAYFLLIIGGLVHSSHVVIVGVVDEEWGASRRKTEEEWTGPGSVDLFTIVA
jgi:hypothetical protein